jgi:hypothetical protein
VSAGSQTFTDDKGDSVADAPDMTTIDVSNDDAGNITMTLSFANRFSDLQSNDGFEIIMDTDHNASTGNGGFDYIYVGIKDRNGLFGWTGSSFTPANANTVRGFNGGGKAGVTVNRTDLGNATVVRFFVVTTRDFGQSFGDQAPNGNGVYEYDLVLPGQTPATTTTTTTTTTTAPPPPTTTTTTAPPAPTPRFVVTPVGVPHTGKHFVVRTRVALGELSAQPGTLACTAKVGTRSARTAGQKGPGPFRSCVVTVPAGTTGKTLVIVLKISFKGTTTTRTLRFRIR